MKWKVTKGTETKSRLSLLLWGPQGGGKTTFAATAPGDKLWISFGDNEHVSVQGRKDVWIMDMADATSDDVFKHGVGSNPFGLDSYLLDEKNIETVVVDSLTQVQYLALEKSVNDKLGISKVFVPSMQAPGRSAYGGRNSLTLEIVRAVLRVTAKHQVNVIFTAHERDPKTKMDSRGLEIIEAIYITLGGQLMNQVACQMSEIWNLRQEPGGKRNRIVTTRVSGYRTPLKTRMFLQNGEASFILKYDPNLPDEAQGQMTIKRFLDQWNESKMVRIPMPANRRGGDETDNAVQALKTVE
jgi:AAA domain